MYVRSFAHINRIEDKVKHDTKLHDNTFGGGQNVSTILKKNSHY